MTGSSSASTSFDADREHLGKIYAKGLLGAAETQQVTDAVLEATRFAGRRCA